MENLVDTILSQMSTIKKPQKRFIRLLFSVFTVFMGKANFRNLSRYCSLSERGFSRWFKKSFPFSEFNQRLIQTIFSGPSERIAVIDASFLKKSGRATFGLGLFWNGSEGRAKRGLECSLLAVVDLPSNTAYALEAKQTLPDTDDSRVEQYLEQVLAQKDTLKQLNITYLAADSYYSKKRFVLPIVEVGFHLVGALRKDAALQWLYEGEYSGKGRPKKFDGKVIFPDALDRCDKIDHPEFILHSAVVWSNNLQRKIRILFIESSEHNRFALLYSTDVDLDPLKLLEIYQARFQIEFLFRDAKQHAGLHDCQARNQAAIHTHINAALTSLNLMKLDTQMKASLSRPTVISIASIKRIAYNQHMLQRLFQRLNIDPNDKNIRSISDEFINYGAIAA